jgi:hypothetical protein
MVEKISWFKSERNVLNLLLHWYFVCCFKLCPDISITVPTSCTVCFQFIAINSLYMFRALICSSSGGTVYTNIGMLCQHAASSQPTWYTHKIYQSFYIQWLLMMSKKSLKHVQAIDRNKLKTNSATCWSCCTGILRCTVNKTLRMPL